MQLSPESSCKTTWNLHITNIYAFCSFCCPFYSDWVRKCHNFANKKILDQALRSPLKWHLSSLQCREDKIYQHCLDCSGTLNSRNFPIVESFQSFLIQDFAKWMWEGYRVIKWLTLHKKQYVTKRITYEQKLYWSSGVETIYQTFWLIVVFFWV